MDKRHFTVVIGSKEHGLYISSKPSSAAKKAVSKLCASNKSKKVEFCLREITQGSKKKVYGPYIGYIERLKEPIKLKGSGIKFYKVVTKKKSIIKKGGMKGGEATDNIVISLGNCGRGEKFSFTNPFKKCIVLSYNDRKITIIYDEKIKNIIVKYFDDNTSDIYYKKEEYRQLPDLFKFSEIINELWGFELKKFQYYFNELKFLELIVRIRKFINEIQNDDLKFRMIDNWLKKILEELRPDFSPSSPKIENKKQVIPQNKANKNRITQKLYEEQRIQRRAKEAENERQKSAEILKRLKEWGPTSDQGSAILHRTNWSNKPNYTSFTIQEQIQQQQQNLN
jgi:hypothetical protein